MWKYVTFVVLIIFSVPAVLGQKPEDNKTTDFSISTTAFVTTIAQTESTTQDSPNSSKKDSSSTVTVTEVSSTTPSTSPTDPSTSPTDPSTSPTDPSTVPSSSPTVPSTAPSSSPTVPSTTVHIPSTTALPPPAVGTYNVTENNTTCIRAEMALRVDIGDLHDEYNLPINASIDDSSCNATGETQILKLTDEVLGHSLTLIFVEEEKKSYVQNITFFYRESGSEGKTWHASGHFFEASSGKSYLCNSESKIKMENTTLSFSSVHIQAFGAEKFGLSEECDLDDKVGDIVPIAVGCALAALVVIVLIAYLVGRRRSRQRGYQSV